MQPAMMPQGFVVANACLAECWRKHGNGWALPFRPLGAVSKLVKKKALRPGPGQGGNQPNQMQQHGATESA